MAKRTSPVRMAVKKSEGKQNTKNKKLRSRADANRQIHIQKALYEIADAASAVMDMQSFYRKQHEIVGKLMYAENFFIATHNEQSDLITWPYYVDTVDVTPPVPILLSKHHGATGWILRHGETLADVDGSVGRVMKSGEVEMVGSDSDGIGIPLKGEGKTIGVLIVQSYKSDIKYTLEDIDILNFVAQHISTALMRVRAIDETRQRNAELAIINSVQEGLASKFDIQEIYDLVGDKVREIFNADTAEILSYNHAKQSVYAHYYVERGQPQPPQAVPFGKGLYTQIIQSHQPLMFGTQQEWLKAGGVVINSPGQDRELNESYLGVPILLGNEVTGTVSVQSYQQNAYGENDVRLLTTLANAMSVALQNAQSFKAEQERVAELAVINSVQEGLAGKLDMQSIYELVGEKIRTIFNAQVVNIVTYDRTTQLMQGRYYFEDGKVLHGMTLPAFGFRKHVVENCQPIIINKDMQSWMEKYDNPVVQGAQPKSAIFIPMIAGNEAMGVISLQNNDQENAFSETDIRLLGILANSMSIALENARLWEQEKMYRKALERELEIGREIQAGFLPEALPLVAGWEIAASLMSAREVAGDFYDVFELPDGTMGLVIADVCDKGVGAALFMTLFRSLIRAVANLEYFEHTENPSSPTSTPERLKRAMLLTNNYIAETHGDSGMFATLFFGILDPHDGRLTYINGGHEPPFILQSGNVREVLRKTGPAVGTIKDGSFALAETRLQAGDIFVAYTDGVLDCTNPRGEFYGREHLLEVLQNTGGSALELVNTIETDLRQFIAGASQFDDMTLLVTRRDSDNVAVAGS